MLLDHSAARLCALHSHRCATGKVALDIPTHITDSTFPDASMINSSVAFVFVILLLLLLSHRILLPCASISSFGVQFCRASRSTMRKATKPLWCSGSRRASEAACHLTPLTRCTGAVNQFVSIDVFFASPFFSFISFAIRAPCPPPFQFDLVHRRFVYCKRWAWAAWC